MTQRDASERRLWEVDHPYYCSESNYYVGGEPRPYPNGQQKPAWLTADFIPYDHLEVESWEAFGWKDSDPDMNLLFRWDWMVCDPADHDEDECPPETLWLFWMLQRKGRFMAMSMPVKREEEPEIRAWLAERAKTMAAIWDPIRVIA